MSSQEGPKRFRIISDEHAVYVAQNANTWLQSISDMEQARYFEELRTRDLKEAAQEVGPPTRIEVSRADRYHSSGHRSFLASQSIYDGTSGRGTPRAAIQTPRPRPRNS